MLTIDQVAAFKRAGFKVYSPLRNDLILMELFKRSVDEINLLDGRSRLAALNWCSSYLSAVASKEETTND